MVRLCSEFRNEKSIEKRRKKEEYYSFNVFTFSNTPLLHPGLF